MFTKKDSGKNSGENLSEIKLKKLLEKVSNPMTHKDIVSMGAVDNITIDGDGHCVISLKIAGERKLQINIEAQIRTILSKNEIPAEKIKIKFLSKSTPEEVTVAPLPKAGGAVVNERLPQVKKIIGVASGKGGVGKSTVSLNLAVALQNQGFKVGLIDADIYGPSIGKMIGMPGKADIDVQNDKIIPVQKYGVKFISFGFLIDEKQPVVWRGPMLGKAVEQFLFDVAWPELDFLVIDLPPGTGDTHLSLAQLVQTHGMLIVSTPQQVAKIDAERAIAMFKQVNIPILGIVENMVEFLCPHCGQGSRIFGEGAGNELAQENQVPLLGSIPLSMAILQASEGGRPVSSDDNLNNDVSLERAQKSYDELAKRVASL